MKKVSMGNVYYFKLPIKWKRLFNVHLDLLEINLIPLIESLVLKYSAMTSW
jgi:hypothetical protein